MCLSWPKDSNDMRLNLVRTHYDLDLTLKSGPGQILTFQGHVLYRSNTCKMLTTMTPNSLLYLYPIMSYSQQHFRERWPLVTFGDLRCLRYWCDFRMYGIRQIWLSKAIKWWIKTWSSSSLQTAFESLVFYADTGTALSEESQEAGEPGWNV